MRSPVAELLTKIAELTKEQEECRLLIERLKKAPEKKMNVIEFLENRVIECISEIKYQHTKFCAPELQSKQKSATNKVPRGLPLRPPLPFFANSNTLLSTENTTVPAATTQFSI